MIAKKYMLMLVGSAGQDLAQIAPHLKALNFEVGWIQRSEQVVSVVKHTPHISLVVLSALADNETDKALLASLRDVHPNMPVIWVEHSEKVPTFTGEGPNIILQAPIDAEALSQAAATLLRERFYTRDLIGDLVDGVNDVTRDTFGKELAADEPILKVVCSKGGELSTIVYFAGRGISGHIIASATPEFLMVLHDRILPGAPKPSLEKLADLLGEFCNRVTGRLRVRHRLVFNVGAPILVHGAQVVMRQITGSPALIVRFAEEVGSINVELCLHKLDESSTSIQTDDNLPPGDVVFL